jgi:Raf kinase inhibitor-like YbhB/YbcL family protein
MKETNMKFTRILATSAALLISTSASFADGHAASLTLSSSTISEGAVMGADQVFEGFGCTGGNMSPDLTWANAPEGTESFVVTVYDPDAPTGSGWWHWSVFNIPADVTSLAAGMTADVGLPDGAVELVNDYGATGFGGACPPAGEMHRYQFTVHALPVMLDFDASVSNALLGFMTQSQAIASSKITAVYHR